MKKLQALLPTSPDPSFFGGDHRRKSLSERVRGKCMSHLKYVYDLMTCNYILDPTSKTYFNLSLHNEKSHALSFVGLDVFCDFTTQVKHMLDG